MTHNQIENKKLKEQERANRASETLKQQENIIKAADVAAKSAGSVVKGVFNDVSWYAKNPQLLKDTANLSFKQAADLSSNDGLDLKDRNSHKLTKTNILRLGYLPVLGKGTGPEDNLTVAIRNIYTVVRHKNSGHTNYEAPDLGMFIAAMDSIYCAVAWMQRVYATGMYYNPANRTLPAALLTAMGVNIDSVVRNLANFRGFINKSVAKLQTLFVPKTLSVYKRHIWMNTNVFKDSSIPKASYYLFSPTYLLKYDAENGKLVKFNWFEANAGATVEMIMNKFDELVNAIYGDEDFNIMMGDMLKAYGEQSQFELHEIPEDLVLEPAFSQEVLSQVENYRCYGAVESNDIIDQRIDEEKNESYIYCNPIMSIDNAAIEGWLDNIPDSIMMNFHKGDVKPEDVVVASRCTVGLVKDGTDYLLSDFGTEIPTYMDIISYGKNMNPETSRYGNKLLYIYRFTTIGDALCVFNDNDGAFTPGGMQVLVPMSAQPPTLTYDEGRSVLNSVIVANLLHYMDWAPLFILPLGYFNSRANTFYSEQTTLCDFWDYDNYAVVNYDTLHNIHEMCVLSELDVPAKVTK